MLLDAGKRLRDVWAKLPLNPFTATQTVAMLTAVSAFVFAHQSAGFVGDVTHVARTLAAHVQDGAHMQSAHRSVRIPSAFGAMAFEHLGELVGVFGQVLEWHSAVFNEADRFAVALQTHHDVEARFAYFPQIFLRRIVHHFDHAVGQS